MKRITTTALLLAMLLSLYGCGGGENPEKENVDTDNTTTQTESTETETETEDLFAAYRSIDLGGRTVHISVSSNISEGGGGMPSSYPYIAGPEEMTGEAVADSVYTRNQNVEELLNCKLEHIALDLEYNQVQPYIENMVISGDTAIDYYAVSYTHLPPLSVRFREPWQRIPLYCRCPCRYSERYSCSRTASIGIHFPKFVFFRRSWQLRRTSIRSEADRRKERQAGFFVSFSHCSPYDTQRLYCSGKQGHFRYGLINSLYFASRSMRNSVLRHPRGHLSWICGVLPNRTRICVCGNFAASLVTALALSSFG